MGSRLLLLYTYDAVFPKKTVGEESPKGTTRSSKTGKPISGLEDIIPGGIRRPFSDICQKCAASLPESQERYNEKY